MSEYSELLKEWADLVEGKHPLVEKRGDGEWLGLLRGALSEAAQAIERLEGELDEEKEQRKYLMGLASEDAQQLRQQLADARAEIERKDEALDRAKAAIWDSHYGKGITAGYARKVSAEIDEALATPAPGKDSEKVTKP